MITKMTPAPQASPLMSRTRKSQGSSNSEKVSYSMVAKEAFLFLLLINSFLDSYLLKQYLLYSAMGSSSHGTIVKNKADFHSEKQQQWKKKKRERETNYFFFQKRKSVIGNQDQIKLVFLLLFHEEQSEGTVILFFLFHHEGGMVLVPLP